MIKINDYLSEQFKVSLKTNLMPLELKKVIFHIVRNALIKVYGENYSIRCLQSSLAIIEIFNYYKVKSVIVEGNVCFALVYGKNPFQISWGGFWDKDHHYWVMSQFQDIIDLTIAQFHLHPNTLIEDQIPILPIWWTPAEISPKLFKYLPDRYGNPKEQLEKDESDKIKKLKDIILYEIEHGDINLADVDKIEIVTDMTKLNSLYNNGNIWICAVADMNNQIEFPEFIKAKEKILIKDYYKRKNNGT